MAFVRDWRSISADVTTKVFNVDPKMAPPAYLQYFGAAAWKTDAAGTKHSDLAARQLISRPFTLRECDCTFHLVMYTVASHIPFSCLQAINSAIQPHAGVNTSHHDFLPFLVALTVKVIMRSLQETPTVWLKFRKLFICGREGCWAEFGEQVNLPILFLVQSRSSVVSEDKWFVSFYTFSYSYISLVVELELPYRPWQNIFRTFQSPFKNNILVAE